MLLCYKLTKFSFRTLCVTVFLEIRNIVCFFHVKLSRETKFIALLLVVCQYLVSGSFTVKKPFCSYKVFGLWFVSTFLLNCMLCIMCQKYRYDSFLENIVLLLHFTFASSASHGK